MCFFYRLDNEGDSHLADITQLLFVRALRALRAWSTKSEFASSGTMVRQHCWNSIIQDLPNLCAQYDHVRQFAVRASIFAMTIGN